MSILRKISIFSVVILFSILPWKEVLAESTQSYKTTGEISFYGTYEYPNDKPEITLPAKPIPNGSLPTTFNPVTSQLNRLPQTGESSNKQGWLVGYIFLISSIIIYKKIGGNKNEIN